MSRMRRIAPYFVLVVFSFFSIFSHEPFDFDGDDDDDYVPVRTYNGPLDWQVNLTSSRRPRKILVSGKFGKNSMFKKDVNKFRRKAVKTGAYSRKDVFAYYSFPTYIREDPTWSVHLQFLNDEDHPSARGGGYWFWKSVLIEHHLKELDYGDFIFFHDVDVEHFGDFDRSDYIVEEMIRRNASLALAVIPFLEQDWTKGDIFKAVCKDNPIPLIGKTAHYSANMITFRKTPGIERFVKQWKELVSDFKLVSDEPSVHPSFPHFVENRHDQSLLNVLIKCGYPDAFAAAETLDLTGFPSDHDNCRSWDTMVL